MIEHIQKYKAVITLSIVAVAAGFVLGGSSLIRRSGGGGRPVLKIAGRTYDDVEFQRLGTGSYEMVSGLARSGDFGLFQFLMTLSTGATNQRDAPEKFFIGRMILRQAKEEFGIYPGEDEISDYLRSLRAFADKDGKFSEEAYRHYIDKGIGRLGLTEGDLRELASDVLASKTLNAIVGAGLAVNRDIIAQNAALDSQQIEGNLGRLALDPFEAKIEPTDEQIKAYWEERQDAFMTEELRKFTYLIVAPVMPPDTAADKADAPETLAEATASDEAKKAAAKKKEEEKAKKAADLAEARRQKQHEIDVMVDDFSTNLEQEGGKGTSFEDLAKANKWDLKTTELIPRSKPPADFDLQRRSSSRSEKVVDALFRIEPTSDSLSKFSEPLPCGENQWLLARLDGVEKARPKTFDEAKVEARAQYIHDKGAEAMKTAATEAVTKIKEALAAGKSFADAAKDAGITDVKAFTKVNSTYHADTASEPKNLFEAARNIDPDALAEPIIEADRAFILHVAKREVVKDPAAIARLDSEVSAGARNNETIAFAGWITSRTEAAKVEQLYRK